MVVGSDERLEESHRPLTIALLASDIRKYHPRQHGSDCIHISRDRFSKAGKTILDPSMRSSIRALSISLSC